MFCRRDFIKILSASAGAALLKNPEEKMPISTVMTGQGKLSPDIVAALNAADTPSALNPFVTASSSVSLSDYKNVVVVDEAGNGDFTKLSDAFASITDATSSNRYAVAMFGDIVESAVVTGKDYVDIIGAPGCSLSFTAGNLFVSGQAQYLNVIFASTAVVSDQSGKTGYFINCTIAEVSLRKSGELYFQGCRILGAVSSYDVLVSNPRAVFIACILNGQIMPNHTVRICVYASVWVSPITCFAALSMGDFNINLEVHNSYLETTTDTQPAILLAQFGGTHSVKIHNSRIEAKGANSNGLSVSGGPFPGLLAESTSFKGTSKGAVCDAAWANAPFYHCQFENGVTNITPNAGTPLSTCVSF